MGTLSEFLSSLLQGQYCKLLAKGNILNSVIQKKCDQTGQDHKLEIQYCDPQGVKLPHPDLFIKTNYSHTVALMHVFKGKTSD